MKKIKIFRGFLVAMVVTTLLIQGLQCKAGEPLLTQYYEMPSLYNPAAVGVEDALRMRLAGRLQWVGMDDYPKSFAGAIDMPLTIAGKKIALGVNGSATSEGLRRSMSVNLQGAYKFNISGGSLTAALNLGYGKERFKGSLIDDSATPEIPADNRPHINLKGNLFDFGAGLYYSRPRFWIGISGVHLNSPRVTLGESSTLTADETTSVNIEPIEIKLNPTAYLMAGGNISTGFPLLELMPSMILRGDCDRFRGELTTRVRYRRMLTIGVGYRFKDAVSATVAFEHNGFFIGYAYDYPVTSWSRRSNGSHELVAGYSLKLDLTPPKKGKYKSIRIM